MALWNNTRELGAALIRKGGPGNAWQLLDLGGAEIDAPTGGAADVESRFGLDANGRTVYLGSIVTGDPARFTTSAMFRLDAAKLIEQLRKGNCPFDLFIQQRCGDVSPLNYTGGIIYYDGHTTNKSFNEGLAKFTENVQGDVMRQLDLSLAPIEDAAMKLRHLDISNTVSDFAINKVISVGSPACVGQCNFAAENDGEQDFWAVSDADNTPGHGGTASPRFLYTEDGGTTWSGSTIDDMLSMPALGVAKAGDYVVVVGSSSPGAAYARFQDIKDGVSNPWTASTGISGQFPNAVVAVSSDTLYACGNGGYVWKSTDGGFSWTALSAGTITTQNLTEIAALDSANIYFAGAAGALLVYANGVLSQIVVRTTVGGAAITANFTAMAVAPFRANELFLGTSTGLIYRSRNIQGGAPVFASMSFPNSGIGSVDDLQFGGYRGSVLFIVQTNAAGTSRVLRDISGGNLGNQVEVVGGYTNPANFGINSIAPASITAAVTVGEVHETYGLIGKVTPAAAE